MHVSILDSGMDKSFWVEAMTYTVYVRNRLPTTALPENLTPFEALTGHAPNLSHLRIWGCSCSVLVPNTHYKLQSRAVNGWLVGVYEEAAYQIWVPSLH